jgi:putative spermidine/putrescine transport system substrate-binding protein
MIRRGTWAAAVVCAALFAAAGCGGGSDNGGGGGSGGGGAKADAGFKVPKVPMAQSVGAGEGKLNIIAWAGYAEDGSTDPKVDWVTPFEKKTGCQVNVKIGNTSDEMVTLMRTGQYDGVSASGDATLRLIAGGDVAPVNTKLVPNYADVFAQLKDQEFNSVNGQMYGIPHGRGANLLMWRSDKVPGTLDSWSAVFDQGSKYKGSLTAYDNPIYIADAALYLKATKPALKITNPYELDDNQFKAAVDLLKSQRQNIGEYWSDYTKEQAAFTSGDSTVGTTWQVIANLLDADKVKVKTTLPKEGATGWSDTWMISSKAKHPNCMYKWMDWIISPKVNAEVAEWFGEAPSNAKSCAETSDKSFCKTFHADDQAYFGKVSYWTTPRTQCGDARGSVCKDYAAWVQAWTEIKG